MAEKAIIQQRETPKQLLHLPDELLCRILSHLTIEYNDEPSEPDFRPAQSDCHAARLRRRLQRLVVCKKIYSLAQEAHWSQNWTAAWIRVDISQRFIPCGPVVSIYMGDMRETELCFRNVRKLQLFPNLSEVGDVAIIVGKMKAIMDRCYVPGNVGLKLSLVSTQVHGSFVNNRYTPSAAAQATMKVFVEEEFNKAVRDIALNHGKSIQLSSLVG